MNRKIAYVLTGCIIAALVVAGYVLGVVFDIIDIIADYGVYWKILIGVAFTVVMWGVLYALVLFAVSVLQNVLSERYRAKRFLKVGRVDVFAIVKDAWLGNFAVLKRCAFRIKQGHLRGKFYAVAAVLLNIPILFSMGVFGSLTTAVLSVLGVVGISVVLAVKCVIYWIVALEYKRNTKGYGVRSVCPYCKNTFDYPVYICPDCGRQYPELKPSVVEIFHKKCACGNKLPTTYKKKRQLEGECPYCHRHIKDLETRPIVINVVGADKCGKTALITSFVCNFIEEEAPLDKIGTAAYDMDMQKKYEDEVLRYFNLGHIRESYLPATKDDSSTECYSFFLSNKRLVRDRLLHIFNINGELFINRTENERQMQYSYADGLVLVLDPLTIDSLRLSGEGKFNKADAASCGEHQMNYVMNVFLSDLREVTGLKANEICEIPLAVVLTKIDCLDLDKRFGKEECAKLMKTNPKIKNEELAVDYLVKQFLCDYGQANIVNNITMKFKNNRFFAVSAIGHSKNEGKYIPVRADTPFKWIIGKSDGRLGKMMNYSADSRAVK
ncbi:MAG: hypothetical protein PHX51_00525 [Clostridia bacterium]|nr:hypothetical protein [Clostridia bacterium]